MKEELKQKIRDIIFDHESGVIEAYRKKIKSVDFDYSLLGDTRQKTWERIEQLVEE